MPPAAATGLCHRRAHQGRREGKAGTRSTISPSIDPQARINSNVGQIGEQIHGDDGQGQQNGRRLNHRIIPLPHGLNRQEAHAGDGKEILHHKGPGDQESGGRPQDSEQRQQGIEEARVRALDLVQELRVSG